MNAVALCRRLGRHGARAGTAGRVGVARVAPRLAGRGPVPEVLQHLTAAARGLRRTDGLARRAPARGAGRVPRRPSARRGELRGGAVDRLRGGRTGRVARRADPRRRHPPARTPGLTGSQPRRPHVHGRGAHHQRPDAARVHRHGARLDDRARRRGHARRTRTGAHRPLPRRHGATGVGRRRGEPGPRAAARLRRGGRRGPLTRLGGPRAAAQPRDGRTSPASCTRSTRTRRQWPASTATPR